jgi:hypothetical protein
VLRAALDQSWGSLGESSPWKEFANGVASNSLAASWIRNADTIFAVDWSGHAAATAATAAAAAAAAVHFKSNWRQPPIVWLNYRVFSRQAENPFYRTMEAGAAASSDLTIALAQADQALLAALGSLNTAVVWCSRFV